MRVVIDHESKNKITADDICYLSFYALSSLRNNHLTMYFS